MTNIIVHGFMGKMGGVICRLIEEDPDLSIAAGIDYNAENANVSFPVFKNPSDCDVKADAIIDFSTAKAIPALLAFAEKANIPVVLCTTGLDACTIEKCDALSKKTAVFKSANMSLGINLLADILEKYGNALQKAGFDIEIIEKHHNLKIDAPSGTALLLGDAVNEGLDNKCAYVYDRSVKREKRSNYEIGMSSIRGGTIVGEHSVIFAGLDEIVEFTHMAHSKEVFGVGAVNAAKFLKGKPAGMYSMKHLMKEII